MVLLPQGGMTFDGPFDMQQSTSCPFVMTSEIRCVMKVVENNPSHQFDGTFTVNPPAASGRTMVIRWFRGEPPSGVYFEQSFAIP